MQGSTVRRIIWILGLLVVIWLGLRYLLPVLLPFLLALVLALAAEPAVRFASSKLRLPRPVSAVLGVSVTLILLVSLIWLLGALAVRELGSLAGHLPDVEATVEQGMALLQDWTVRLSQRLPERIGTAAVDAAQKMFNTRAILQGQLTHRLPTLAKSVLSRLPGGALGLGTGLLASYMLSIRLPRLRQWAAEKMPDSWHERYLPALRRVKGNVTAWLKAQCKLSAVTYGIVTVGFLLMGIPFGPFWALLVALVDAVPVLGTGTVLLPWALICLVQGQRLQALGLVLTYGVAMLARIVLEPRLVGRHLGLDPLLTLLMLYTGYRFWGIPGMILAPLLTAAVKGFFQPKEP